MKEVKRRKKARQEGKMRMRGRRRKRADGFPSSAKEKAKAGGVVCAWVRERKQTQTDASPKTSKSAAARRTRRGSAVPRLVLFLSHWASLAVARLDRPSRQTDTHHCYFLHFLLYYYYYLPELGGNEGEREGEGGSRGSGAVCYKVWAVVRVGSKRRERRESEISICGRTSRPDMAIL